MLAARAEHTSEIEQRVVYTECEGMRVLTPRPANARHVPMNVSSCCTYPMMRWYCALSITEPLTEIVPVTVPVALRPASTSSSVVLPAVQSTPATTHSR